MVYGQSGFRVALRVFEPMPLWGSILPNLSRGLTETNARRAAARIRFITPREIVITLRKRMGIVKGYLARSVWGLGDWGFKGLGAQFGM